MWSSTSDLKYQAAVRIFLVSVFYLSNIDVHLVINSPSKHLAKAFNTQITGSVLLE